MENINVFIICFVFLSHSHAFIIFSICCVNWNFASWSSPARFSSVKNKISFFVYKNR